jgi:nucleotide-binding universal stress UspA family protein
MPERFLVCVDFSPLTDKTIGRAVRLATPGEAMIDLVHALPPPSAMPRGSMAGREILEQAQKARREAAQRDLDAVLVKLPDGLRGAAIVAEGTPADAIVGVAKKGYDLVVIATHGRTGLQHALLGSVAETVVRTSPTPVLVVR